jgi:hypothetical protein
MWIVTQFYILLQREHFKFKFRIGSGVPKVARGGCGAFHARIFHCNNVKTCPTPAG